MKKIIFCMLSLTALFFSSCSKKENTLKLGTNAAFPPFEYTSGGKITGFDIGLSEAIAKDYGLKLEIKNMDFDALIAALQSDAVDFVAAGMTITDERKNNVDFSIPYFTSRQALIINKSNDKIKSASDLNGLVIGCQAGTTGQYYAEDNIPDADIRPFKTGVDAVQSLKVNAIDAIILDILPATAFVKRNPSLAIADDNFYSEEYAIAVKKGNTKLLDSINNTIITIQENGEFENLTSKFLIEHEQEEVKKPTFYNIMIENGRWEAVPKGLAITLLIAICAIIIGSVIGCFLALGKISGNALLSGAATFYTTVIRGIPMATQLMIFYFVIFSPAGITNAVLVAIIAFGINSGAYCAEIFRSGIQSVDKGQVEAGRSLGLSWKQTLIKIVLPQAIRNSLPTFASEFITLIKETSVASFIAVVDLQRACDNIRNETYNAWIPLLSCAVIYLCLTVGLTKLFSKLEKRMAKSDQR